MHLQHTSTMTTVSLLTVYGQCNYSIFKITQCYDLILLNFEYFLIDSIKMGESQYWHYV